MQDLRISTSLEERRIDSVKKTRLRWLSGCFGISSDGVVRKQKDVTHLSLSLYDSFK